MSSTKDIIFAAFASVLEQKKAIYAAGPLSTCKEYYEALAETPTGAVIDFRPQNEIKLRTFVAQLRRIQSQPVIDPSIIRIPDWSPTEIGDLYLELIATYASEVWFLDGWEYSRGSTKEFVYAVKLDIGCKDQRGNTITQKNGLARISQAANTIGRLGCNNERFLARIRDLGTIKNIPHQRGR